MTEPKWVKLTNDRLHSLFAGQLDLKIALREASRLLEELTGAEGVVISLYEPDQNRLVVEHVRLGKAYRSLEISAKGYHHTLSTRSVEGQAISSRNIIPINRNSLSEFDSRVNNIFQAWGVADMLVIPLYYGEHLIGSMLAFKHHSDFTSDYSQRVEHYLESVTPYLFMITQYHLYKRKEDLINSADQQRRETINIISKLGNIHSLETIYQVILDELLTHYPFQIGSIHRTDGEFLRLSHWTTLHDEYSERVDQMIAWAEKNPAPLDGSSGVLSASLEKNTYVYVQDAQKIKNLPMSQRDQEAMVILEDARSNLFIPIRQGDQAIGVIWLSSIGEVIHLDGEDRSILEGIGSFLGTVIENAEMYAKISEQNYKIQQLNKELESKVVKLHELATHDFLTGLYNFGYFQKAMDYLVDTEERSRKKKSMCLVIADIDHFKKFNDTYGHEAGNVALKHVANIIARHAREGDIVCRYGGEEFTVLLPKCDLQGAKHYAERVRKAIETTPVYVDGKPVSLTISLGCTRFRENETSRACISRADDQLYRAKRKGRNRVEAAD